MKNGDEPISPLTPDLDSSKHECIGLTKREYFAAMAMQGLISKSDSSILRLSVAEFAVRMADTLLAELEKPTDK